MISWSEIAGQFARDSGDLPFDEQAREYLKGLPETSSLLVACSGGSDSVLLVLMLLARLPQAADRLHLCHFNHGIRGDAADGDAKFVANLADSLGLPCHVGFPKRPLEAKESALRAARYDWLVKVYKKEGAAALCLGHHADDVLESQLMAIVAGSGPAGLAAPLPVKHFADGHVRLRPLLGWRKAEIEERLATAGVPWREDATNADPLHTRNWIRKEIVPRMAERLTRNIYAGSDRTRRLMAESVDAIDAARTRLSLDLSDKTRFPARPLVGQPSAVIRRSLLAWWLRHYPESQLEANAVDELVSLVGSGRTGPPVAVGADRVLDADGDGHLRLRPASLPVPVPWRHSACWSWASGPVHLPGGGWLQAEIRHWKSTDTPPFLTARPEREAWLAIDIDVLEIRQWQAGDRYPPLGSPGSRKLQDLFTDAKLNREQKHRLPVIDTPGGILWVPGFPPNDAFKVPASANSALKLTYNPYLSGFSI